ncbi:MAG TPA: EAL domain-containing protein [Gemmatimonadaceae bacterium]|nr:EAL domain-containing protein [Gemmatimonadaceae bacterium]
MTEERPRDPVVADAAVGRASVAKAALADAAMVDAAVADAGVADPAADSVLLADAAPVEVRAAMALLPGWRIVERPGELIAAALDAADPWRAVLLTTGDPSRLRAAVKRARLRRLPVVMACRTEADRRRATELRVSEWYVAPATPEEIASRVRSALARGSDSGDHLTERVENVEYEGMLYDALTGLPTLPVMIERTRELFAQRGEMIVLYLNFVRYSKIEEIYGWEKLDQVLETTAAAVREFMHRREVQSTRMLVSFINDDDFVFFHIPPAGGPVAAVAETMRAARELQTFVGARLEETHGEDIAALFDIYIGHARVYYNPKVRVERLIYRGIREAAQAAKSIEQRERQTRVADLKEMLHERAVYIEYHPIVSAPTGVIAGYEALARGSRRQLRSPEVMFEVAAQADLLWELGRLCRERALEGIAPHLQPGQLLFLNIDPHDFDDPEFGVGESIAPERVVLEITERTAITDYPRLRERLQPLRERGYRFAVDDAGSGYAGLGSIANLEPDFIKLDISLITSIDTNFIKQNLVETMVRFASEQGAQVIAEGVERAEELETVRRLGVHLVQGFFLHAPARAGTAALAQGARR